MDRASGGPVIVGSPSGGTSIEDVAATNPELIFTEPVDITIGITNEICSRMATNLGLTAGTPQFDKSVTIITNLYGMFVACDCTQVEINPLAKTPDGQILVCDAKLNFDDNAEFRQKSIHEKRDISQEDPREVEASKFDLNYIALDGNIGCMVNGAGLAMSTMDIIQLKGGMPANFLDVGGSATTEQVKTAFEILSGHPKVNGIFVNIFGGIMKCDVIAQGIIEAASQVDVKVPITVRLVGTNADLGMKMISEFVSNNKHIQMEVIPD